MKALDFERIFNAIFGSQWDALALIAAHMPEGLIEDNLLTFHNERMAAVQARNPDFTLWLRFLLNQGLVIQGDRNGLRVVFTTPKAAEFRTYIAARFPYGVPGRPL